MSVLWSGVDAGRRIEVRSHGRTRRLYVDGVLHTSWNPSRALTGAVWDHLALSTFFVAESGARRVLVLGVGGGAALQMLRRHAPPERMIGVDLDARLLRLARRWFGLGTDVELVRSDAARWLEEHPGERFDLLIDDLYVAEDGEPVRPPGLPRNWWRRLAGRIAPRGALVVNFVTEADLFTSPLCQDLQFRERFPAAVRFSCPGYENAVAAFLTRPMSVQAFRARLARQPELANAAARRLMRFRVHRLWPS